MLDPDHAKRLKEQLPNENFCTAPFMHTHINVNNRGYKLCCMSHVIGRFDNLENSTLDEEFTKWWTGPEMQDIRQQFLDGKMPDVCKWWCGTWEEKNIMSNSDRYEFMWRHFRVDGRLDYKWDIEHGTLEFKKPVDVDIRPTKLCNLKCRSCNSIWSDKIEKEVLEHPEIQKWSHWDNVTVSKVNEHRAKTIDWTDDSFDPISNLNLDEVRYLKMSGGETLLDPRIYRMLKKIVDEGYASKMRLHLIVNGTVLPNRTYELLKEFENVRFNLSIDALGEVEEYLRTGTVWADKLEVIEKMFEVGYVGILCTMQPVNMFHIKAITEFFLDLHKRYGNRFFGVKMNSMVEPWYLHCGWLDEEDKEFIREEMEHCIFENRMEENGTKWWLDTAFVELDYDFGEDSVRYANDFVRASMALDEIRGGKQLLDIAPYLQKYYDRYDPENVTNATDGNRPAAQWKAAKPKAASNMIELKNVED